MITFVLSDDQLAKVMAFKKDHKVPKKASLVKPRWLLEPFKCQLTVGTIGDLGHYRICPTGIGDFISYHCACGAKIDLNDYDSF